MNLISETPSKKEMIRMAEQIRMRDQFGLVSPEELEGLSVKQEERHFMLENGKQVHIYELKPDIQIPSPCPLIINFHGGGFMKGRSDRDRRYCSYLAENLQCMVWDVDYCLAPEEPFPSAVDECYGAAVYAFTYAEELGVDSRRIAMAGHSAGGNLVAAIHILDSQFHKLDSCALLMEYFPADHTVNPLDRLNDTQRYDEKAVDRAEREALYQSFYCTKKEAENPLCSPVKASLAQLRSFPDCLVISAGKDSLKNETEQFAQRLAEAGATVTMKRIPEAIHGFTVNRTEGWERALELHREFFYRHFFKASF